MPANVEIKARVEDFEATSALASRIADDPKPAVLEQRDVFFSAKNGRLKLRHQKDGRKKKGEEDEDSPLSLAELIAYDRADSQGPKQSTFSKTKISDPAGLEEVLAAACGVKGVVSKVRHLFLVENRTRIHLDKVEGLEGAFLELEVMLKEGETAEEGQTVAEELMEKLNVGEDDLISGAYMDMLLAKKE